MVYKRYIYKNGKKIGPYYYENKKVNGKVVSTYLGTTLPKDKKLGRKKNNLFKGKYKYFILGGVVLLFLITFINFVVLVQLKPTGEISINLVNVPEQGELLSGIVTLNLKQGELIPANTQVLIDNSGKKYTYLLSDLIKKQTFEDFFYMRGFSFSEQGLGFGEPGEKKNYPKVDFVIKILNLKQATEVKQSSELSKELSISGNTISEFSNEIKAQVSLNTPFVYELKESQTAEIVSSSQEVDLDLEENQLIVTTDYYESEQGFGEQYLTKQDVEFSFDLQDLEILAQEGELTIELIYNNEKLLSTTTDINYGKEIQTGELEQTKQKELEKPVPVDEKSILSFPIFFENFENNWVQVSDSTPGTGDCSQKGNFNNCDNNLGDYEFASTSYTGRTGLPLSGNYWLILEDWDTWDSTNGIWYSFNPSTVCGGEMCDVINVSFEFTGYSLDNTNEWCSIRADDNIFSDITLWQCTASECSGGLGTIEVKVSDYLDQGASNWNIRIASDQSGRADECYFDNINITGYIITENEIPTQPINIKCNGDDNCDISVNNNLNLKALGSTDSEEDEITYFLEAFLQNSGICINNGDCVLCGLESDCSACSSAECNWQTGSGTTEYEIFFEDFETNWIQELFVRPLAGDCSQIGGFNGCGNNKNDYRFDTTSSTGRSGLPLSDNYWLIMDDWDSWNPSSGIWYSFDPSTACNGESCDYLTLSFEFVGYEIDFLEWCGVRADDDVLSDQQIWQCTAGACSGGLGKIEINLSDYLDSTDSNWNIRIASEMSSTGDECFFDDFKITGYKSYSEGSCYGDLNCSLLSQSSCESCTQCSWDISQQWIEIGNHKQGSSFNWDTSSLLEQTDINLRARAIDLTGSNFYSDYFTKNPTPPSVIIDHGANDPPQLEIQAIPSQIPEEAGTNSVTFNIYVSDSDGYQDINYVNASFDLIGETTKTCVCVFENSIDTNIANYSCTIDMQYYDKAGDWQVTAQAIDLESQLTTDTDSFIYQELKAMQIISPVGSLEWPALNPEQTNILSTNHPTIISNTGNYEGEIFITAYDLIGETTPSETLACSNFRVGPDLGSVCIASQLQNSTQIEITSSFLSRGLTAQEEIYHCITQIPSISPQTYSATGKNAWVISV